MTTTTPTWSDSGQSDLLELVARGTASGTADDEWDAFLEVLRTVAIAEAGDLRPNTIRPKLRGLIHPRRIGAYHSRALHRGLIAYTGEYEVSNDTEGKNGGKPCRVMRARPALFAEDA